MIEAKVEGITKLNRNLKKLQGRTANNIITSAARAAANEIKKEAASNLPSYHRKKLMISKSRRQSSRTRIVFKVGPKSEHWALNFLEFGVRPHDITPKTKKALVNLEKGIATKKVRHPGVKIYAFMRKAATKVDRAQKAFIKKAWQRINKELAK